MQKIGKSAGFVSFCKKLKFCEDVRPCVRVSVRFRSSVVKCLSVSSGLRSVPIRPSPNERSLQESVVCCRLWP